MTYTLIIDDTQYNSEDPVLTGRQLLELANRIPTEEHVVLHFGEGRQLEDIDLEETVDLREPGRERFVTFHSDRLFKFELDGQRQEWGADSISETVLRRIAGLSEDDQVWQARQNEPDLLLTADQSVSLDPAGLESFYTKRTYTIIVNAKRKTTTLQPLPFDNLLALAFNPVPTGEFICFSVTYSNGPNENPEGTFRKGQRVRIQNGMEFSATFTDKS